MEDGVSGVPRRGISPVCLEVGLSRMVMEATCNTEMVVMETKGIRENRKKNQFTHITVIHVTEAFAIKRSMMNISRNM